jgi:hypothetical protein
MIQQIKQFIHYLSIKFCRHRFYIVQNFDKYTRRIACEKCKQEWAMNDRLHALLPWDKEFDHLYFDILKYRKINPWR